MKTTCLPFDCTGHASSSAIGGYRYFFNGQEADNEVLGDGVLHAFEYRMHDTRIGRFWSVDPLAGKFPWNSTYAFAENRVVDGRELEGLEWDPNKPLTTTNEQIPLRVVNARDQLKVEVSLKTELRLQMSTKTVYAIDPGEIRPVPSEYEKAWAESAGYFGTYIYLDPIVRATAVGGFAVTTGLFGQYVASDVLPYAVRGGGQLYSLGLKVYNNSWGKRAFGFGLGYVGNKLKLSPDITPSDPTIATYSLLFQFLFDTWEKDKPLFDDKLRIDTKTFPKNTDDNAKSNNTKSTKKES